MINKYFDSVFFGTVLMGLTYLVANFAGWVDFTQINWLEIFAVWTSYVCTLLCVHQSSWNYPIGIVTTALYSYLFYQWDLPAVALFNLYLVFSLSYGWYYWGSDDAPRSVVTRVGVKEIWLYVVVALGIYGLLYVINTFLNHSMSFLDIAVAVWSGVAQFLLDRRKIETWIVWAVVNVLSIWLYYNQGLYLVTLQYFYFLFNTGFGYYVWNKSLKA